MTLPSIRPEQYIAGGQIALATCIFICLALAPRFFFRWDQGGISNYGTLSQTTMFYAAGFGAAGLGTALAAMVLPKHITGRAILRVALLAMAILYSLVLLSTFHYKLDTSAGAYHEHTAQALLFGGLVLSIYLRTVLRSDLRIKRAFVVFCAGTLLAVLTLAKVTHLLFTAQLVGGASFGYMLTRGVGLLARPRRPSV